MTKNTIHFHGIMLNAENFHQEFDHLTPTESAGFFKLLNWDNTEAFRFVLDDEKITKKFFAIPNIKMYFPAKVLDNFWALALQKRKEDVVFKMIELELVPFNRKGTENLPKLGKVAFEKAMKILDQHKWSMLNYEFALCSIANNHFNFLEKEGTLSANFFKTNFFEIFSIAIKSSEDNVNNHKIDVKQLKKTDYLSYQNDIWDNFVLLLHKFKDTVPMSAIENIYKETNSLTNTGSFRKRFPEVDDILCDIHIKKSKESDFKTLSASVASMCLTQEVGYKMLNHYNFIQNNFDLVNSWARISFWKSCEINKVDLKNIYYCYQEKNKYFLKLKENNKHGDHSDILKFCNILLQKLSDKTNLEPNIIKNIYETSKNFQEFESLVEVQNLKTVQVSVNSNLPNKLKVL